MIECVRSVGIDISAIHNLLDLLCSGALHSHDTCGGVNVCGVWRGGMYVCVVWSVSVVWGEDKLH